MNGFDDTSDEALIRAIRKRLLDEISTRNAGASERIVNNVYGAGPTGLVDRLYQSQLGQQPDGEDPYEYYVDIERDDKLDDEGNKIGWTKNVRRYRDKKKVKTM